MVAIHERPRTRQNDQQIAYEQGLVEKAKKSPEAFGGFYEAHVINIYSYFWNHTGHREDAEDLTQRVFLNALEHIRDYKLIEKVPVRVYLFRIAHNELSNHYRYNHRRKGWGLPLENLQLKSSNPEDDPHECAERNEENEKLRNAVAGLQKSQREIVILKYTAEMTCKEIGMVIGKTEGAVKAMLNRAIVNLRKKFKEE